MLSKSTKRVMAATMALALAAGSIGYAPRQAAAATAPSLSSDGITVKVDAKKTVKIRKGSYTIKSVNVKPADNDYVDLDWTNKKIVIEGEKKGSCTLTVVVKAQNARKKTKKFKLTLSVTVKAKSSATTPTPIPTQQPTQAPAQTTTPSAAPTKTPTPTSSVVTVYTQADLDAALAGGKKSIEIGTNANNYLVIGSGTYSDVDLTINSPNAAVTNYGSFKSINIKAIRSTYTEGGKNNSIVLNASTATKITVDSSGNTINSLTLNGVPANNGSHNVEVKNGTVNSLTLGAQVRAQMTFSGSSLVKTMTLSASSSSGMAVNDTAQINNIVVKDNAQFSINGNTSKQSAVDLTGANSNARVYIYTSVISSVNSMESLNNYINNVVINKTNASILNVVKKSNGTTYNNYIDPTGDAKTTIDIAPMNVNTGDTTVNFYVKTPQSLDLTNSAFQFTIRKGSSSGTIMNTKYKYAALNGSKPYYYLTTDSGLSAGTYYILMSTNQAYVLRTTTFTVRDGSGAPSLSANNFTPGATVGTTKLINIDTGILEYFVDNKSTVPYPDYMDWQNFNSSKEVYISAGQYIHVRKMEIGSSPASAVATYQVQQSQINGSTTRAAAAEAVLAVVREADNNGNFTMNYLYTAERFWRVNDLISTAINKISDYVMDGARDADVKALPGYSTYATLCAQFNNTASSLIIDIDFSAYDDWPISAKNAADACAELASDMAGTTFIGKTGDGSTVNISVSAWEISGGYSPTEGDVNLFVIKTFTTGFGSDYKIANDVKKGKGIYALNVSNTNG